MLSSHHSWVRLFILKPGCKDDVIVVVLHHIKLNNEYADKDCLVLYLTVSATFYCGHCIIRNPRACLFHPQKLISMVFCVNVIWILSWKFYSPFKHIIHALCKWVMDFFEPLQSVWTCSIQSNRYYSKVVDIEAVSVVSRKAAASRKRNHHKTVTRKIITQNRNTDRGGQRFRQKIETYNLPPPRPTPRTPWASRFWFNK